MLFLVIIGTVLATVTSHSSEYLNDIQCTDLCICLSPLLHSPQARATPCKKTSGKEGQVFISILWSELLKIFCKHKTLHLWVMMFYVIFRIKRVQRISLRRLPRPKPGASHDKLEGRKVSNILEDFESFSNRSVSRALSIHKRYDRMEDDVTTRFTRKCSLKCILSSPIRYNRGSEKCFSKMKNIRSEEKLDKEDAFYSC